MTFPAGTSESWHRHSRSGLNNLSETQTRQTIRLQIPTTLKLPQVAAIRYEPAAAVKLVALATDKHHEQTKKALAKIEANAYAITFEYLNDSTFPNTDPAHCFLDSPTVYAAD